MWTKEVTDMIIAGVGETLYMTLVSTFFGYIFGMPLGILLKVSDKEGLRPNAFLYKFLDVLANIFRSIPFLILLILLIPFTRFLVGKSYGTTATIVPLTIAAIPFIGRMVESSLNEVDPGVIEAARSMGAGNLRIVFKVMLVEARTSLISGATIVIGTILGYSAMTSAFPFEKCSENRIAKSMSLIVPLDSIRSAFTKTLLPFLSYIEKSSALFFVPFLSASISNKRLS